MDHAGYTLGKESHILKGGRKETVRFYAMWSMLEHPEHGYILFDTGYSDRFIEETKSFPSSIYRWITKVFVEEKEYVRNRLTVMGIDPKEIKHLVLSHFHGDHTCGLKDFPNATIYTSRVAYEYTINYPKLFAFSKAILKGHLPEDIDQRLCFVEDCTKVKDAIFGHKYDLFGDGSIYAYDLPGHAAGQIGICFATDKNSYFLVADACWNRKSIEGNVMPSGIVKTFIHSWKDLKSTIEKLYRYHKENPEVIIVPTHCADTTLPLVEASTDLNRL